MTAACLVRVRVRHERLLLQNSRTSQLEIDIVDPRCRGGEGALATGAPPPQILPGSRRAKGAERVRS